MKQLTLLVYIFKTLIFKIKLRISLFVFSQGTYQISNRIIMKLYASSTVVCPKVLTCFDLPLCIYSNIVLRLRFFFFFFALYAYSAAGFLWKLLVQRAMILLIREYIVIKLLLEIWRCAFVLNIMLWNFCYVYLLQ